ncbi:MAG: glycosyltransferase [Myxococcota bacterium]
MKVPSVTLCVIAKDEESMLGPCLDSVKGLCSQLVVVDTGSTDRTKALAREHGAEVYDEPWTGDFAAARNASIARATGDFVLILDADERLGPGSTEVLRRVLAKHGDEFDCGLLRLHDAVELDASPEAVLSGEKRLGEMMYIPRLLRRTPDLRYRGIVHESVREWVIDHNRQLDVLADIVHYGAVPDHRVARDKSERNVSLLEKRLQLEPDDFTIHGYLAHELTALDDIDSAWSTIEEGWRLFLSSEPSTLRSVLRLAAARVMIQFRRGEASEVLETVSAAEGYEGPSPDLWFFRGRAYEMLAQQNRDEEGMHLRSAAHAYTQALEQRDAIFAQRFVRGASKWAAEIRLGTVHLLRGALEEARPHLERGAADAPPAVVEGRLARAELALEEGQAHTALSLLAADLDDETPDALLIAAGAHESLGDLDAFERFLMRARSKSKDGYLAPHRNLRHGDAFCALLTYKGKPTPSKTALGNVVALMAGAAPTRAPFEIGPRDRRLVATLIRNLLLLDRPNLVEPLLADAADDCAPGIKSLVLDVIGDLGMSVEETN